MIYVTMVYGPIAAMLVELFPTRIRYTSMSLPYHIGNGWFGGLLPSFCFAITVQTGNIYNALLLPDHRGGGEPGHRRAVRARDQGHRHLRPRLRRAEALTGMGPRGPIFHRGKRPSEANLQGPCCGIAAAQTRRGMPVHNGSSQPAKTGPA